MAVTPAIFAAAERWAQSRPYGCSAGQAVRDILVQLTGPPRVAACTLSAPVPLNLAGTTAVRAAWPVTQPGVDVCFLIHRGPPPPRVRSRMTEGPALFLHVQSAAGISAELIPDAELLAARVRLLCGELRALALRHPEFAEPLRALADLAPGEPAAVRRTVAVIGPDPAACRSVSEQLESEFCVRESGDVDAVVAVAAAEGWSTADAATLTDALGRIGRLVSTAPLPAGVPDTGVVVAPGLADVPRLLEQVLARPRAASTPAVEPGNWRRAMGQLRRRSLRQLEAEAKECTQTSQIAAVAERHGVGPLPERGVFSRLEPGLVAVLVGCGVVRLLWPLVPVLAVLTAVVVAVMVGVARWRMAERKWLREMSVELRRRWAEPDMTSAVEAGPAGWVRRQLAMKE